MDQNSVAIISIIVTGCVSIFVSLVPTILKHVDERNVSRRMERERIDKVTSELMNLLSHFKNLDDLEASSGMSMEKIDAETLAKYYAWERAVWIHLRENEKIKVIELKKTFEGTYLPGNLTGENYSRITNDLISITESILLRIK